MCIACTGPAPCRFRPGCVPQAVSAPFNSFACFPCISNLFFVIALFRRLHTNPNHGYWLEAAVLLKGGIPAAPSGTATLLRLSPSYRFCLRQLLARSPSSGTPGFHGLTGGVYKVRERIHRAVADARLLAIPPSWGRVPDPNPNWGALSGIGSALRLRYPLYAPL